MPVGAIRVPGNENVPRVRQRDRIVNIFSRDARRRLFSADALRFGAKLPRADAYFRRERPIETESN